MKQHHINIMLFHEPNYDNFNMAFYYDEKQAEQIRRHYERAPYCWAFFGVTTLQTNAIARAHARETL